MLDEAPKPKRSNRPLSMLTMKRPRCPKCNGVALKKHRSISDQGDGSSLSWVTCRNERCRHRFRLVLE